MRRGHSEFAHLDTIGIVVGAILLLNGTFEGLLLILVGVAINLEVLKTLLGIDQTNPDSAENKAR